jgi:copper oxidase (laccase) domain-containing protein
VQLDLAAANRWQLVDAGVNPRKIAVSGLCTGCRKDLFFSYRKEVAGTGRMLSAIGISAHPR